MSAAVTPRDEFFSLLTRCSAADKSEMLAELARQVFGQQSNTDSFPINDGTGLVGYLIKPNRSEPTCDLAKDDPEFYAEMLRRIANPEPCLTREEVRELFGSLEADQDDFSPDEVEDGKGAA
jgi:hypothetical protein